MNYVWALFVLGLLSSSLALGQVESADNNLHFISGIVFNDTNGNSIKDCNESTISGWTAKLIHPNETLEWARTDQNGSFRLTNLTEGVYLVSVGLPLNWLCTDPSKGYYAIAITDNDVENVNFGVVLVGPKNNAPSVPSTPDGQRNGIPGMSYTYSTVASDIDEGDLVKYTFDWGDGDIESTGFVSPGTVTSLSHTWPDTGVYQVKVNATDSKGACSEWSTPLAVTIDNPPGVPSKPSGQASGTVGTSYSYATSSTDADGDQIKYTFSWGDGMESTTGFNSSGATAGMAHTWSSGGVYEVRVYATDSNGVSSDWSAHMTVAINTPPGKPSKPSGQASGAVGTSYSYATSSIDADGDLIKYTFSWGDGMESTTGFNSSGVTAAISHSWSAAGEYDVKVYATDSRGVSSDWSVPLSVSMDTPPSIPQKPTGQASGTVGTSYSYATSSTDADGDQIKYTFSWGDGMESTTGFNSSGATAGMAHTWSSGGVYHVRVYATDSKGISSDRSLSLSVAIDTPPDTPSKPSGQASGAAGTSYSYYTSSDDADGDMIKYTFSWGDGMESTTGFNSSGATVGMSHTWSAGGTYEVKVYATDSNGVSSNWSVPLSAAMDMPPGIPLKPTGQASGIVGSSYNYTTSSTDADGDQIKYTFSWGDGMESTTGFNSPGAEVEMAHTWTAGGAYEVKVYATDSRGFSSVWSTPLSVAMDTPPGAPSKPSGPGDGYVGTSYGYSTAAADADGDLLKYTFSWGDGMESTTGFNSSGVTVGMAHVWQSPGNYSINATATDSKGISSAPSLTKMANITGIPNHPPSIPSKPSGQASGLVGSSYVYTTASTDADGDQIKYTFSWGEGMESTTGFNSSGATAGIAHTWSSGGTYDVKVYATDSKGASSLWSTSLSVSVDAPPGIPSKPSGQASGLVGSSYIYTTASTDTDGDQIKYTFSWGDGMESTTGFNSSGATAGMAHTWTAGGEYDVKAYATDSRGVSSELSEPLPVAINALPGIPSKPSGQASGLVGSSYVYTTASTDTDGDQIKYTFSWGDGEESTTGFNSSGATAGMSHSWSAAGSYSVTAAATDSRGASSGQSTSTQVTIAAVPSNNPPVTPPMPARSDPCYVEALCTFTTSTVDPENDMIKYTFDWGDGTQSVTGLNNSGMTVGISHMWPLAGTYSVKVIAEDTEGASSGWSPINALPVTIPSTAPGKPTLISPSGTVSPGGLTFRWWPVSGSTKYTLRIATARGITKHMKDYTVQETISGDIRALASPLSLISGSYAWSVRGYNENGGYGAWSTPMGFAV